MSIDFFGGAADSPAGPPQCSAKGCRSAAVWVLVWNNPKLHTPDREKVWVACDAHRESLAGFLSARSFLKRVEALKNR